jgi:hypothetical protein
MEGALDPGSPAAQGFPLFSSRGMSRGTPTESDRSVNPIATMPRSTKPASLDAMLDMLSDSHRRRILLAVSDHNPRDEDEFVTDSFIPSDAESESLQHIRKLRHIHLPKLDDRGYIEWNQDTETIRRGPNFDDIAPLLQLMDDHEDELPNDWP